MLISPDYKMHNSLSCTRGDPGDPGGPSRLPSAACNWFPLTPTELVRISKLTPGTKNRTFTDRIQHECA